MSTDFKPGLIFTKPRSTDWQVAKIYQMPEDLPSAFNLRYLAGPVTEQRGFGTCAAHSGANVKRVQEALNYAGANYEFSPLFLYSEAKKVDGFPDTEGTTLRAIMEVLAKRGVCLEKTMPYSGMVWPGVPDPQPGAYAEAKRFVISGYAAANSLAEVKFQITQSRPVLAGILVCENFLTVGTNGFVPMPAGRLLGGHAVTVVGYDDSLTFDGRTGFLQIKNSHGPEWGELGFGWIPYDYFHLVADIGYSFWPENWSSVDYFGPAVKAKEIIFEIGKDVAIVDGRETKIPARVKIDSETGRALGPVRALAELLGYAATWSEAKQQIKLKSVGGLIDGG